MNDAFFRMVLFEVEEMTDNDLRCQNISRWPLIMTIGVSTLLAN